MSTSSLLKTLLISEGQSQLIESYLNSKAFSVYHELRFVLYGGILMLTSGLGVIIYENIDTIGHQVIIGLIAIVSVCCFFHAFKNRQSFSWSQTTGPNKLADYSLQYQYSLFGTKYGFAVILPTIVFFYCAYRFDHAGVLSMAITGLASWLGLTIAPLSLLSKNDFTDPALLISAIVLGLCLIIFSKVSEIYNLKGHFAFSYLILGGNLAAVAATTGLFLHDFKIVYFIISAALSIYFIIQARNSHSAVFLLVGVIYGYIVFTYALFKISPDSFIEVFVLWYFLFSSIGVLFFLLNFKKILGITR
jgi:hypothetical protein